MAKIDRLCANAGVRIVPTKHRRGPRETHARRTLTKLARDHGDGHVLFVLRTIVDSRDNASELWSETILAISDIVLQRSDLAGRGLAFIEAFDALPLRDLRLRAKAIGVAPTRQALSVLLTAGVEEYFAALDRPAPALAIAPAAAVSIFRPSAPAGDTSGLGRVSSTCWTWRHDRERSDGRCRFRARHRDRGRPGRHRLRINMVARSSSVQ